MRWSPVMRDAATRAGVDIEDVFRRDYDFTTKTLTFHTRKNWRDRADETPRVIRSRTVSVG